MFLGVYLVSAQVMASRRTGDKPLVEPMMTKLYDTHDDVIKWKHFHVTDPLCGEFTGHRGTPLSKASDPELWCFIFDLRLQRRLSKQSRRLWFVCD